MQAVPPVLHRDIKSSNILLDQSMRARVCNYLFRFVFICVSEMSIVFDIVCILVLFSLKSKLYIEVCSSYMILDPDKCLAWFWKSAESILMQTQQVASWFPPESNSWQVTLFLGPKHTYFLFFYGKSYGKLLGTFCSDSRKSIFFFFFLSSSKHLKISGTFI